MEFLHDLWLNEKFNKRSNDSYAIIDPYGSYTYNTLKHSSYQCAIWLKDMGIKTGDRIVIVADSSFYSICFLLASSIVGSIFTVISPETPQSRYHSIIEELDPVLILFEDNHVLNQHLNENCIEPIFNRFCIHIQKNPSIMIPAEKKSLETDAVWIIFTSGTTGKPKGIVMSHVAVVSFFKGLIDHIKIPLRSRYASLSPLQFDFSLLDIGLCLSTGTTLYLPNKLLLKRPEKLIDLLVKWEITHLSSVPTVWKLILKVCYEKISQFVTLKQIIFAGEHFPVANMRKIYEKLPEIVFYNIYGQSESIACTFEILDTNYFLSNEISHAPVGKGHSAIEMMLWDENNNRIYESDRIGELVIRGLPLFSGYWKLPEETSKRLINDPNQPMDLNKVFKTGDNCFFDKNGCFYFVGRLDNQVKINGNRIEIEEIEKHINSFKYISNCCVFTIVEEENEILCAALVLNDQGKSLISGSVESDLRYYLSQILPRYMLPRRYYFHESIPVTENGKNDRKKMIKSLIGGSKID
ncbi:AMP-binding protein [Neisseria sp.]|uniref:AMP-binding protein n=1 Tax=Neisseria sp. TaxID=192066 RepID=UPI0026DCB8EE|nr:AMP-binding protein [Neisseria sp.]MDO4907120.1 AMP-binding protein [Neisseria sp.]